MPVYRVEKNQNYTVMSNTHLRDAHMSWKAKGLLSYILSLPGNWDFSAVGLAAAVADGVQATRSALKELETLGYLIRRPVRGADGRIADWEYIIYEEPRTDASGEGDTDVGEDRPQTAEPGEGTPDAEEPLSENPVAEYPEVDIPEADEPAVENLPQLNTKEINTKEPNTELINNKSYNTDSPLISVRGAADDGVTEALKDAERVVAEAGAVLKKSADERAALNARFERFWDVWPRKVARKAALSAFMRVAPDDGLTDRMIAAVKVQIEKDSRFRETRYTPHPATWINGAEWENGYDEPKTESSFDTGEFFDIALKRSYEAISER